MTTLAVISTAASSADATGGANVASMLTMLIPLALIIVFFYFFIIRPEKKRNKEMQNMLNSIQVADEVITNGGIIGRVLSVKEDTVLIETGSDRTKIRETVMDRFADFPVRLYPVGRLDYDSEGLLLLTNDGELAQRLTHPSCEVDKVYLARVTGNPSNEALDKLRRGVYMEGDERRTYPAQVRVVRDESLFSDILVTIHEGRNRQVRRMFDSVGHKVLLLRRVRFGPLDLGDLRRGEWRELSAEEIAKLKAL